jgi:hypothetical protein
MAVNLSPVGGVAAQFFDNAGNVLTGGKLYTYAAGTTTPQTTYTTSAGNVAWSNPIILDAAGRVSGSGEIWLTDGTQYKFILRDSNDVLIATYDNIIGINSNFVNFTNEQEIQTATAGQTVFNLTTMQYSPGTNSLSVFVDGVNQYGPGAQYAYLETDADTITFVNGLHVGALVKFTTSQLNSSAAVDAQQVSYNPPFVGAVATNVEAKLAQTVSVKDFGAVGDGTTNDTTAIQAALNSGSRNVYFPQGTYIVTGVSAPAQVWVYGDGFDSSILKATSACDFLLETLGGNNVSQMQFDGNSNANKGVKISGDFCNFYDNKARRCVHGFYNVNKDVHNFVSNRTDNCTYSIYSADRFITCVIDRHYSALDDYAVYLTYSAQQPQFVTISNSSFESNTNGIYIGKDIYWLIIENTSFNAISNRAIWLDIPAPSVGSDIFIKNNYITSDDVNIIVAEGYYHVVISQNQFGEGQNGAVTFPATTTVQTQKVTITENNFGRTGNQAILIDSVEGCSISDNIFTATQPAPYDAAFNIVTLKTYTGGAVSPVIASENTYKINPPYAAVGISIKSFNNIGWITKNQGTATLGAGFFQVTITHGLSATPTQILLTAQANVGAIWASNITSTTFIINWVTATSGTTVFTWSAASD